MSNNEESQLEQGYVITNESDPVPVLPGFITSSEYSFWGQHELPSDVTNPWKVDPMYAESASEHSEYIKEHKDDVAYFLYRIEGGTFTKADILKSPEDYNEDYYGGWFYHVTVPLTINGKPAKYKFIAYKWSDRCDVYHFDDVIKVSGFPDNIAVGITKLSNGTWGLRGV